MPVQEGVNRQSEQVDCPMAPPALTSAVLLAPWHSANLCPGISYPRTESLVRKNLEMGAVKGPVQVQDDQKSIQRRSQPACASCKINRWLLHANVSGAYTCVGG